MFEPCYMHQGHQQQQKPHRKASIMIHCKRNPWYLIAAFCIIAQMCFQTRVVNFVDFNLMTRTSQQVEGGPEEPEESIALLIAGQCHRFVYREQTGPLFLFSNRTDSYQPKVDVYIVLHCASNPPRPFHGQLDTPSYMIHVNVTDIELWYHERGANKVQIKILDDDVMEEAVGTINKHVTTIYLRKGVDSKTIYDIESRIVRRYPRWNIEARKFFLRHTVYAMSLQSKEYSGYVFLREDNYFVIAMDIDTLFFSHARNKSTIPLVMVDNSCRWGAYSDKIYVSNKRGTDLLFSPDLTSFLGAMKSYIFYIYFNKDRRGEPYQPESWVQDTLSVADVVQSQMSRFDIRFVNSTTCISPHYYCCTPLATRNLAFEQGYQSCQKDEIC